ncbi:MAG: hypothetical protein WCK64_01600 [Synechococcaceae cyanobacterium ELA445]
MVNFLTLRATAPAPRPPNARPSRSALPSSVIHKAMALMYQALIPGQTLSQGRSTAKLKITPFLPTEQAKPIYLRFRKISPTAETAILTCTDDNLRRNPLQYWDLGLGPIYIERTKPRFIAEANGALRLAPLPVNSYGQAKALNSWDFGSLFQFDLFAQKPPVYRTTFKPFSRTHSAL